MKLNALIVSLALALSVTACAGKKAPVLVAQSGLAVSQAIGQLQTTTQQLQQAGTLPAAAALHVQEALLALNTKLMPLPDLLRTIDDLQKAGDSTTDKVEQAVAILTVVGQDLSVVIAGVPIDATSDNLIALIRAAQNTIQTTLVEVGKLKGAN